jgi:predicted XRE-type DNA-binding protein
MTTDVRPYTSSAAQVLAPEIVVHGAELRAGVEDCEMTRTEKIRIAARVLIKKGVAGNGGRWGLQSRLAEHFGVTRQRVSQIVRQEIDSLNADPR